MVCVSYVLQLLIFIIKYFVFISHKTEIRKTEVYVKDKNIMLSFTRKLSFSSFYEPKQVIFGMMQGSTVHSSEHVLIKFNMGILGHISKFSIVIASVKDHTKNSIFTKFAGTIKIYSHITPIT